MRNINEYKRRFDTLLESTIGNVKPLINEETDLKLNITPEELKKFIESLEPIKQAACLSSPKKRCKKCVEMISNLQTGVVSNKLINDCFSCEFGTNTYEKCEELKGKFKSILYDIQKEKGMEKTPGFLKRAANVSGEGGLIVAAINLIVRQTKELFRKEPTQNP